MSDNRGDAPEGHSTIAGAGFKAPEAADEQIRLAELLRIFAAHGALMGGIVALSLIAAVVFLWWAQPVYRAEVFLLPPLLQDVRLRNVDGVAIASMEIEQLRFEDYEPEKVYDEFRINLQSRNLRREFFDREEIYKEYIRFLDRARWSPDQVFERRFNRELILHQPGATEDDRFLRMSFELDDPQRAAELLNGFVEAIDRSTVKELVEPFRLLIQGRIKALKNDIALRREASVTLISDQIERVDEAAKVAKTLGLVEPIEPILRDAQGLGISVNTVETPIYRRGEKALRAEMSALQERKGSDAFVPGLRDLEEQLARISSIKLDVEHMRSAQIDQAAIVPERAVFPRPALVLALALVAGVTLAMAAAFAHHAWRRIRRELG